MTTIWPDDGTLLLGAVTPAQAGSLQMLGSPAENLQWSPATPSGIRVTLPPMNRNRSKWAWTIVVNLLTS